MVAILQRSKLLAHAQIATKQIHIPIFEPVKWGSAEFPKQQILKICFMPV